MGVRCRDFTDCLETHDKFTAGEPDTLMSCSLSPQSSELPSAAIALGQSSVVRTSHAVILGQYATMYARLTIEA